MAECLPWLIKQSSGGNFYTAYSAPLPPPTPPKKGDDDDPDAQPARKKSFVDKCPEVVRKKVNELYPIQIEDEDGVSHNIAGRCDPAPIRRSAERRQLKKLQNILTMFRSVEDFGNQVLDREKFQETTRRMQHRVKWTNSKYKSHFRDLKTWDLLAEEMTPEFAKWYVTYFSVEKGEVGGRMADRAIINGKALSQLCRIPPRVQLPCYANFLPKFASMAAEGPVYISTGDISAAFHNIRLAKDIRNYLALAIRVEKDRHAHYSWGCLPMGLSHSVVQLQATMWTVMTEHEPGEHPYYDPKAFDEELPNMLPIIDRSGKEIGVLVIYVDNWLLLCSDEAARNELDARFIRNFKTFSLPVKKESHHRWGPKDLARGGVDFLGVQFQSQPVKSRRPPATGPKGVRLRWKILQSKIDRLADRTACTATDVSKLNLAGSNRRQASGVIGRYIHRCILSQRPLGEDATCVAAIAVLSALAKKASTEGGKASAWDAPAALTPKEDSTLRDAWKIVLKNEWMFLPDEQVLAAPEDDLFIITDASTKDGYGIHISERSGRVLKRLAVKYPAHIKSKDLPIFYLEVYAGLKGLQLAQSMRPACRRMYLGQDSTSAIGTIRRGYSHLAVCTPWLKKYSECKNYQLHNIYIPTNCIVSDDLSHFRSAQPDKEADNHRRILLEASGICTARLPYTKGDLMPDWRECDLNDDIVPEVVGATPPEPDTDSEEEEDAQNTNPRESS